MARWNEDQTSSNTTFLLGALAGALVGAGVALLMAPKSGAQMRRELNSGLTSAKDAAARRYRDLADKASQNYRDIADKASQTLGQDRTSSTGDRYNGGNTASTGDSFTATPGTSGYQS